MQNEIVKACRLLDEKGNLLEKGYSKKMLLSYHRENIKANPKRIKEWDYYLIYNSDFAVALTVADNSYMGLLSASIIRLKDKREKTVSKIKWNTKGTFNLPESSITGDLEVETKTVNVSFLHQRKNRRLFLI